MKFVTQVITRAGFSVSRSTLFRKKCGAPHLRQQALFFLEKLATFF